MESVFHGRFRACVETNRMMEILLKVHLKSLPCLQFRTVFLKKN